MLPDSEIMTNLEAAIASAGNRAAAPTMAPAEAVAC
jgi:hypothetical protein